MLRFEVEQVVVLFGSELALDDQVAAVGVGGLLDLEKEFGAVQVER